MRAREVWGVSVGVALVLLWGFLGLELWGPGVLPDPDKADMGRLFTDVRQLPGPIRSLRGVLVGETDYALEPGYLTWSVRRSDGALMKVVLNESTRVVWPGTTEETRPTGYPGEFEPPPSSYEVEGLEIVGHYRIGAVGPLLDRETQAFLVDGRFRRR